MQDVYVLGSGSSLVNTFSREVRESAACSRGLFYSPSANFLLSIWHQMLRASDGFEACFCALPLFVSGRAALYALYAALRTLVGISHEPFSVM